MNNGDVSIFCFGQPAAKIETSSLFLAALTMNTEHRTTNKRGF